MYYIKACDFVYRSTFYLGVISFKCALHGVVQNRFCFVSAEPSYQNHLLLVLQKTTVVSDAINVLIVSQTKSVKNKAL